MLGFVGVVEEAASDADTQGKNASQSAVRAAPCERHVAPSRDGQRDVHSFPRPESLSGLSLFGSRSFFSDRADATCVASSSRALPSCVRTERHESAQGAPRCGRTRGPRSRTNGALALSLSVAPFTPRASALFSCAHKVKQGGVISQAPVYNFGDKLMNCNGGGQCGTCVVATTDESFVRPDGAASVFFEFRRVFFFSRVGETRSYADPRCARTHSRGFRGMSEHPRSCESDAIHGSREP